MKRGILLGALTVLTTASPAIAAVEVKIDNNVNSTQQTTTNSLAHTKVTVTTNGETKTFESNGEKIDYKSDDGNTSVRINSEDSVVTKKAQSAVDSVQEEVKAAVDTQKAGVEKKVEEQKEKVTKEVENQIEEQKNSIIDTIKNFFKNIFSK